MRLNFCIQKFAYRIYVLSFCFFAASLSTSGGGSLHERELIAIQDLCKMFRLMMMMNHPMSI